MTTLEPSGDVGASTDGSPAMTCGSVAVVDDDARSTTWSPVT